MSNLKTIIVDKFNSFSDVKILWLLSISFQAYPTPKNAFISKPFYAPFENSSRIILSSRKRPLLMDDCKMPSMHGF